VLTDAFVRSSHVESRIIRDLVHHLLDRRRGLRSCRASPSCGHHHFLWHHLISHDPFDIASMLHSGIRKHFRGTRRTGPTDLQARTTKIQHQAATGRRAPYRTTAAAASGRRWSRGSNSGGCGRGRGCGWSGCSRGGCWGGGATATSGWRSDCTAVHRVSRCVRWICVCGLPSPSAAVLVLSFCRVG
jgi:hypothetical protein